ncbi:hypothetical protein [Staphylococcus massiliensis]|uniref:Uncharacterized protein n=1 Tax=Staphylococcus massiliensis S46 TaxID=1229783 RepID=K9AKY3_9STAP|nr:hypothetical protein [Staphylococcus massiliensis]EKU48008.1 hypothetical protein C273_06098 [Staphylococcus massiliensis S46]MCG3400054.1 hypothetical protein [Staphylococcus massiliensis]MCG3412215.1 hypothetical protein [Staphylococcus massiliensis]PNZ97780.1 hypothetical protein CD133_10155 [Staphylococcus massiliensis CCUG 55927]
MNDERYDTTNMRLRRLETKTDELKEDINSIKDKQQSQEIVNLKMNYTLEQIDDERKERRNTFGKYKFGLYTALLSLLGTFIWSLIRMITGI